MLRSSSTKVLRNISKKPNRILVNSSILQLSSSSSPSSSSPTTQSNTQLDQNENTPWYLRDSINPELNNPIFKEKFPELPINHPENMVELLNYMINKSGLTDFKIFDLRNRQDELPISSFSDFMIICQGKSEKHLQNSSQDLITFIKTQFNKHPYIEGLIKPNSQIRLKKKLRKSARGNRDNEFGIGPNSWIMIDTKIDNIYLHLTTLERRQQLNLEYLFCDQIDKHLYKPQPSTILQDNDSIFAGIFKRYYSTTSSIEDNVTKLLLTNDFENFEKVSSEIRSNNDISSKILENIVKELNFFKIKDINDEILSNFKKFFDYSFPINPSLDNFITRFEFFQKLHYLSPQFVTINQLTQSLNIQSQAGWPISKPQLLSFIETLNNINHIDNANETIRKNALFNIWKLIEFDIFNDDEILINLLKIFNDNGSITPEFYQVVEFIQISQNNKISNDLIEFIAKTLILNNNSHALWEFWDSLYNYEILDESIVKDSRPWGLLFDILNEFTSDSNSNALILNVLFNEKLPESISNGIKFDNKGKLLELLNKFDQSNQSYSNIRQYIEQQ
ncbi:hypothetical protein WICMUC_001379 [Wickerhamomyces mucosus]|uniref:ATPase synthesis protein 25 n=1 Tax=Wickerhamomyces mucosus TaxID=1378264 RepID=A0A9P8PVX7_9ASCO|nr:hypothetical protein WICMUC_001379 [Wickerhamomyces mucosus]